MIANRVNHAMHDMGMTAQEAAAAAATLAQGVTSFDVKHEPD